ncbi:MAG: hypothetical protein LBF94_02685, partial [Puniceicoccales bacterium]|nr:hypothetical protein [Puniceicoccales bacterium]
MSSATERQNAIQSLNDSTQLLTDHTRLGREISIGKGLTSMARASASLGSREISRLLSRGVFTIHQPSGVFDNPLVGLNSEVQNELKTLNNLVLAILKNFDKTKNFIHGNDILGAETVLERLGQGLQEIDDLLGGNAFAGEDKDKMLLVRKDMETAILIVSQNLFKERVKMSASYVIATYST